jgi:hypothetical protein
MSYKIRDVTRRREYRMNRFQVPHFKAWLKIKEKINVVGIGGEPPGPDFQFFKLYADETLQSNDDVIKVGRVKVLPIAEINGRIFCIIREDLKPYLDFFKITMCPDLFVKRSEVNYLFFLYLVKRESLSKVIRRYRQENLNGN